VRGGKRFRLDGRQEMESFLAAHADTPVDVVLANGTGFGYLHELRTGQRLHAVGTVPPCVVGVGVAGLQAIATAKRLGARVEAFDTRPVVEEQVRSLGAKFIMIDIGKLEQTEQGYAKELTSEQLELQRQGMIKVCSYSDVIITTAQVFGRSAPLIITQDMINAMSPGSVIIDMAVNTGGNVEGSVAGKTIISNGVQIVGIDNLPAAVAEHASQVYANNLFNMIEEYWDKEKTTMDIDLTDEILSGCVITHSGKVVHSMIKQGG